MTRPVEPARDPPSPAGAGRGGDVGGFALHGTVVRLEPLSHGHASGLLAAAREDPGIYAFSFAPRDLDAVRRFVDDALEGRRSGSMVPFATVLVDSGRVVGSTRFADIEWWHWPPGHPHASRSAPDVVEIGYTWLAASVLRTPVNTEAKALMLAHAFDVWGVHRVRFRTDRRNARSWAALERIGARHDGVLRADRTGADGTVRDSAYFSILADEWPAVRRRLEALRQGRPSAEVALDVPDDVGSDARSASAPRDG